MPLSSFAGEIVVALPMWNSKTCTVFARFAIRQQRLLKSPKIVSHLTRSGALPAHEVSKGDAHPITKNSCIHCSHAVNYQQFESHTTSVACAGDGRKKTSPF